VVGVIIDSEVGAVVGIFVGIDPGVISKSSIWVGSTGSVLQALTSGAKAIVPPTTVIL
jgi:hypothetical protein